ncbi:MAG: radical SAM protein [Desulfotomaculales bacterium]
MWSLRKVTLSVTGGCNLRCRHCYAHAGAGPADALELEEIEDLFLQLRDMGVLELEITGGEPLTRPDLMDILELANEMDFVVELLTNGTLVDEKIVAGLQGLTVRMVQIPMEGLKDSHEFIRGHGTYEACLRAVQLLKDGGLPVQVRMTVNRRNLNEVERVVDLLAGMGVDALLLTELVPVGRAFALLNELVLTYDEKRAFGEKYAAVRSAYPGIAIRGGPYGLFNEAGEADCRAERSLLCGAVRGDWCQIMPDGTVTPCDLVVFYAGNVRVQRMAEIWEHSPVFRTFREFDPTRLKGGCGVCRHRRVCGGCRALAFLFTGDFYAEDPMCIYNQARSGEGGEWVA